MGFEWLVGALIVSVVERWVCVVAWLQRLKVENCWFVGYLYGGDGEEMGRKKTRKTRRQPSGESGWAELSWDIR